MEQKAKVNIERFENALQVVDAHTVGEFCRVVIGGFDEPQGSTMIEKKKWRENNCDHLRTALMFEPRGHHEMFGAFLCEPINQQADFGVIFMETGGYLNMCGHCSIGAVTVAVEAGLFKAVEGVNEVVLEAPAGLIRTEALVKEGKVESVTMTNVPSFLYKENLSVTIDGKEIPFMISFGGSFFALVDAKDAGFTEITVKTVPEITKVGMKMLEAINAQIPVKHPILDIDTVDLVEFYSETPNPDKANMRNVVIFGDAMADRSPCGTGTCAKMAALHKWGELGVGEEFVYESFIGSLFCGTIKSTTKVGEYDAVIPAITGSSYLTGVATYLIEPTDPLKYGFQVG